MSRWLFFLFLLPVMMCGQNTSSDKVYRELLAAGNPCYTDNSVVILPSAQEKFDDMFSAISQARRYVHVEYFNLRNDSIGRELLHLLERKAEEGLEVRVLIDAFGYLNQRNTISESMQDSVRGHGVKLQIFDPMHFPFINHAFHRDHRKIVVVDGQLVYTGGINVADYYLHGKPSIGQWRDMHIRMDGPVVAGYEQVFAHLWSHVTGELLDSLSYLPHMPITEFQGLRKDTTLTRYHKRVIVVNREPHHLSRRMRQAYVSMIDAAQREIRIVNPYPTNVPTIRRAMYRALRRGVKLQIMVSATCDDPLVPDLVAAEMKRMMHHGAEVYYYQGGFHHSKIMMVDGEFCTLGTANLDARSMRYDYEVNAVIFDSQTTRQLNKIFDCDLKQCKILTASYFKQHFSILHRISGRIFAGLKIFL